MPEKRVYDLLRTNTYLMIDFLVRKLTQGLFCGYPPVLVVLYGINHNVCDRTSWTCALDSLNATLQYILMTVT